MDHQAAGAQLGLRFDYFNGYVPAQHIPATPSGWIPERNFAAGQPRAEWTDLNPRLGASYDLFGNGRTALKASLGRYVGQKNANVAAANNPSPRRSTQSRARGTISTGISSRIAIWATSTTNGECGPISNQNFGQNNPLATRYADDVIRGFGVRDYLWDFITEVQHQIGSRMSVTAGYNRNWTDNPVHAVRSGSDDSGWQHRCHRQLAGDAGRLQSLLHHGAHRFPAARRRRLSGLWTVRCVAGEVRPVDNVVKSSNEFRQTDTRLGFLQREPRVANRLWSGARRQRGYRADRGRQLLCG